MTNRLLDRQVRLLEFLTSSAAIFDDQNDAALDESLRQMDRSLLSLEARFSYEKRMQKITAVFPRTFAIMKENAGAIARAFVDAHAPSASSRLDNACQFYDFLSTCLDRKPVLPPYLVDIAACEIACARASAKHRTLAIEPGAGPRHAIRRHPCAEFFRCSHDVREVFETDWEIIPSKRDTMLGVALPGGAERPQVVELHPTLFELLSSLDEWIDRDAWTSTPELNELMGYLAAQGIIEVRA
jgi:hypothetical protein